MKHYGDITELKGYMLPEVEVVKGTALWASEIEPFPIAVTKHHFTEEE